MFQTRVVEKWKHTFNNFLRKSCHLWDNVEKYGRARDAADGNV